MEKVLQKIRDERASQDKKWGPQKHHVNKWLAILVEEVGEVAEAMLDKDINEVEKELVQVAAVCVKWLEFIIISC